MDTQKFTEQKIGELVKIKLLSNKDDWSFIPAPLPVIWEMPVDLWPALSKAKEAIARLDGVGRHMPNHNLLLTPLQHREALKSSSLEGTYATPEELLLYQMSPKEPASDKDPVNAWREVFNYGVALQRGIELLSLDIPLSLRIIREMHNVLLRGVRGSDKTPGEFRKRQVQIGVHARFVPPPPNRIDDCLNAFEKYHHEDSKIDPLIRAFMAHYQFETIHPFLDGNGRIGRLLLSLTIFHWLELKHPWLYMSAFFEQYKDDYIDNLFNVSAKGDWKAWLEFCLEGVIIQANDAINRFDALVQTRDNYHHLVGEISGGSNRLHQLVDLLFEVPIINVANVKDRFSISYPTANSDIERLIGLNILRLGNPTAYPKYFYAPRIMEIAYEENWQN